MKKLALVLAAFALVACSSGEAEKAGTAKSEPNSKNQVTTAEVKMKGDKITSISFDDTYEKDGKETTKKTLKDEYGMKAASSIQKEWWEQTEFLEKFIADKGLDAVGELTEEGKPTNADVLSGCTMSINTYVDTAKKAVEAAK